MASEHNSSPPPPPPPPPPIHAQPLQSQSPPVTHSGSSASSPAATVAFSHAISEKLDTKNYLLWCQQVEPVIKGHRLHHFLVNPLIPPTFLSVEDREAGRISDSFLAWEQQDQLLLSWLQSSISSEMFTRLIGCKNSWQLWDKIHNYFYSHGIASVNVAESSSTSAPASNAPAPQVNVAQHNASNSQYTEFQTPGSFSGGRATRGGRIGGCFHGRGGRSSVQCQVCHKYGHDASVCYHRFQRNFVPTVPLNVPRYGSHQQWQWPLPWVYFASPQPQARPVSQPRPPVPSFQQALMTSSGFQPTPQTMFTRADSIPSANGYPDSGASHLVTSNAQNIQQISPFEGPDLIVIGNGQDCRICVWNASDDSLVHSLTGHTESLQVLNVLVPYTLSSSRSGLDECDGNTLSSSRSRKGKSGQKISRRKSSKSKSSRPQRAAARNALPLFSNISGTPTDGEEDGLVGDFSDCDSTLQESNIDSDESGRASQNDQQNYSKGKEVALYESEDTKPHGLTETHVSAMNRRRFVLKLPHSRRDKMYKAVYRSSRSRRAVTNFADGSGLGESTSNGSNSNFNVAVDFSNGTNEALHTNSSLEFEPATLNNERNSLKVQQRHGSCMVRSPRNVSTNGGQLIEEEKGSRSKLTVGLRSRRSQRSSYNNIRETSPANRRKSLQSAVEGSWLLLSTHAEGCRYIPQQGDEVVYLRQGHQEYIDYSRNRESGPWMSLKGHIRAVEYCRVQSLEYSHVPGSGDSCCKMTLQFVDPNSSVVGKSFKLTLPEVTSFPDFLVERTRFDAAMQRNWTRRDKCRVWWKNEDNSSGSWWEGRIMGTKAKSSEFPDSPWERYTVRYKSDLSDIHSHSPWELFDADTQWEQPHIDDNIRNKLLSALTKLQQSGNTVQDRYGLHELKKISNKSKFINRFPVPISLELIQSRLENNYYRSLDALKHDVSVLLFNATSFVEKDAVLSAKIKRLSEWFTRTLSSL